MCSRGGGRRKGERERRDAGGDANRLTRDEDGRINPAFKKKTMAGSFKLNRDVLKEIYINYRGTDKDGRTAREGDPGEGERRKARKGCHGRNGVKKEGERRRE